MLANNVAADTDVTITIQDLGPFRGRGSALTRVTVAVTVRAAPLGQFADDYPDPGRLRHQLFVPDRPARDGDGARDAGGPCGHAVRFDVIGSAYAIVTNNPAQPLASTLTVVSDSTGKASVVLKVNVNAPTQVAQLSVTDRHVGTDSWSATSPSCRSPTDRRS